MVPSLVTPSLPATVRLAQRESGSLRVALLWRRGTDVLSVRVRDAGAGDHFELVVDCVDALDVYYHPYAYAAFRGVDYAAARTRSGLASTGSCAG
jgi:hypothetical protein